MEKCLLCESAALFAGLQSKMPGKINSPNQLEQVRTLAKQMLGIRSSSACGASCILEIKNPRIDLEMDM